MTPYNYRIDAPSVVDRALESYNATLGSGLAVNASEMQRENQEFGQMDANRRFALSERQFQAQQAQVARQNAEIQRQQQRAEAMQARLGELARNPNTTVEDWGALLAEFPEMQQSIQGTWSALDEARQAVEARQAAQLLSALNAGREIGDQKMFIDMALGFSEANKNSGNQELADSYLGLARMAEFDPNIAESMLATTLVAVGDGQYDDIINNGSVPVQSSDILADGTVVQVLRDGSRRVLGPDGSELTGSEAAQAIHSAQQYSVNLQGDRSFARTDGTNQANIDSGGEAAASVDAAKQAVQMAGEAWTAYGAMTTNIGNIDEAIAAIDDGARSGLFAKYLPNITQASASLQNAMDRMGLDVVGAVTFGALSEKELRLAMQTAVPRDLSPPELRAWLVERKEAQEKTAAMLVDAAQYLSDPGNTLHGWVEKNIRESSQPSTPGVQANLDQAALDDEAMLDQMMREFSAQ